MRNLPNIEKSGFHRGQYVGYGAGRVWRIKPAGKQWIATANGLPWSQIRALSLAEMSDKLAAMAVDNRDDDGHIRDTRAMMDAYEPTAF
jgi:hypothetical protein